MCAKSKESGISSGGGGQRYVSEGGDGWGTPDNPAANGFSGLANGTDIADDWEPSSPSKDTRSPKSISEVMDAQGFRGRPRVVGEEEFDRAVKAAWDGKGLEIVRGIGAPDQQTLNDYKDTLTNGEWYVSCSGGSAFGFGQYGAFKTGSRAGYGEIGVAEQYARRFGPYTHVYRYTMDPSAKIGEINQLQKDMNAHNERAKQREKQMKREVLMEMGKKYRNGTEVERDIAAQLRQGKSPKPSEGSSKEYKIDFRKAAIKLAKAIEDKKGPTIYKDVGVFAAAKGYDFYYDSQSGYGITLNRTKMIVLNG